MVTRRRFRTVINALALYTIAALLIGYFGLLISNFPFLVPPSLTIWQAAAPPATAMFMLIGTLVMLPIILVRELLFLRVSFHPDVRRKRCSRICCPWRWEFC